MIYVVYYRYEYASYYMFQSLYDKAVDCPKLCVVTQSLESSYDLLTIQKRILYGFTIAQRNITLRFSADSHYWLILTRWIDSPSLFGALTEGFTWKVGTVACILLRQRVEIKAFRTRCLEPLRLEPSEAPTKWVSGTSVQQTGRLPPWSFNPWSSVPSPRDVYNICSVSPNLQDLVLIASLDL